MNVLLTCAGRRNYLIEFFRNALDGSGSVLAADASLHASTLAEADQGFVVPPVEHPSYLDVIEKICTDHRVQLLIPLNDLELPILARQRDRFIANGVTPVVSTFDVIQTCFDKWATWHFLNENDILGPQTYLDPDEAIAALAGGELDQGLVIKPRMGTASVAIEYVQEVDEVPAAYRAVKSRVDRSIVANVSREHGDATVILQERLTGVEYGLDVVNDLTGRPAAVFVKEKLKMRGGETDRAVTCDSRDLTELGRSIGTALGHVGNLDVDVFVGPNGPAVLELNPRFGGGYPFSHAAGADIPRALLAWMDGRQPDPSWLVVRPRVAAAKCDRLVVLGKRRLSSYA